MDSAKKIIGVLSMLVLAFSLQACAVKNKDAVRAEIDQRGIPYTAESFFDAVSGKNADITELFLASGFDVNTCRLAPGADEQNETAMTLALYNLDLAIAKLLLDNGYQPDKEQCAIKTPPLHYAAMRGRLDMVKLLVKNGAEVSRKDAFGMTPLALAITMRHASVAEYLQSKGAK